MIQTRSRGPPSSAPGSAASASHTSSATNLDDWLKQHEHQIWDHLEVMKSWNMTFEPSQEELFRRFGGELYAPHFRAPGDFWSKTDKEEISKRICSEVLRVCKNEEEPHFGLHINDEYFPDGDGKVAETLSLLDDFKANEPRHACQIRNLRVPRINSLRKYPEFLKDAHIIDKNSATILLQSPGSMSPLHTDWEMGGALSFGTKLWAFFPPTARNMELMRQFYVASTDIEGNKAEEFWLTHALEDGVWLTQSPGELLYTPASTPHAVFTFSWAPFITTHVDTALTFVRNIRFLPTDLAFTGSDDMDRIYLLLNKITPQLVGKRRFAELQRGVAESWPRVKKAVGDSRSR
ncbi:hypothetical protein F4779DRAFT_604210 [Xylariaceae sp. FL0662B]|nr:hypothetical protein F4779DRAFT_604210 [Xylariaceae sp. FL0662B]